MACYFQALDALASAITRCVFPSADPRLAAATGLKKHESQFLVASIVFMMISSVAMVMTWFLHAYFSTLGVSGTLAKYDLTLPQISYTGADAPAYYIFCTCVPLSSLLIRSSIAGFLRQFKRAIRDDPAFRLPRVQFCHCFWCCCCCCCDGGRRRLEENARDNGAPAQTRGGVGGGSHGGVVTSPPSPTSVSPETVNVSEFGSKAEAVWVRQAPECTLCSPYLPYLVEALSPLLELATHSLASLSIVSVAWPPPGQLIHGLSAFVFFYSIIAFYACWWAVQRSCVGTFGAEACENAFGFRLDSKRFRAQTLIVILELFFMFGVGWVLYILASIVAQNTGNDSFLNFMWTYATAINQWVLVALIAVSLLTFVQDIEHWPCVREDDGGDAGGEGDGLALQASHATAPSHSGEGEDQSLENVEGGVEGASALAAVEAQWSELLAFLTSAPAQGGCGITSPEVAARLAAYGLDSVADFEDVHLASDEVLLGPEVGLTAAQLQTIRAGLEIRKRATTDTRWQIDAHRK